MPDLNRGSRLLLNAGANYGRFLLTMAVLLVMTPFIVRQVGEQDFAIWTLTFSVVGFLGLLDGGLATSVVKYVGECRGSGDIAHRNRIVSTMLVLYLGLAAAGVVLMAALSPFYALLLKIPEAQAGKALLLFWLIGLRSVVFALPLSLYHGILFGEQYVYLINLVQVVATLLYAVGTWIGLSLGGDIVLLGMLNLLSMLAEYGAYVVLTYRRVPGLHLRLMRPDPSLLREVASFSGGQLLVNIAALVRLRMDPLLVTAFLPLSAVALYGIALRISEAAFLLTKQAINVLAPLVAELKGANDIERLRRVLLTASRHAFAAATALTVPVCVLSTNLLVLWVGPTFREASPVLTVLMVSLWLAIPAQVAANILVMSGYHRLTTTAQVAGMVLNVVSSVILVQWFGLTGIALGTLAATVAVDVLVVLPAACRRYQISLPEYFRESLLPSLLAGAVQGLVVWGINRVFPATHLLLLAPAFVGGLCAFAVVYLRFGLSSMERDAVAKRLGKRFAPRSSSAAPAAFSATEDVEGRA
ncbi:MAG: hypothetical protein OHK0029_12390 [Armatimonadaceae bacterium]